MTGRERVRLALDRKPTDRVPIAMICSGLNPPVHRAFAEYLRGKRGIGLEEYLAPLIDVREIHPRYIGPSLAPGEDIWGVRRKPVSYGAGSYDEIEYYPLASAETPSDLEKHRWPSPDWFDYASMPAVIAQAQSGGEKALMVSNGNIFESSWYMRGFERMFEDLMLNPELARAIMGKVADFHVEYFRRVLSASAGAVDLAFTADDIGGQTGLLVSLKTWEEFIKPHHVRLNRTIHEYGVKVVYHSDGDVMEAVDGLVDMGIDVLQALQFSAGKMDPATLKRKYHDRLAFEGGVSVQTTLPFGSVGDVRAEVENLITVLGENGGYILGPSHMIQAGTPPENIAAMFDTAAAFGVRA